MMTAAKTTENDGNVTEYLNSIDPKQKREDSFELLEMMGKITKLEPKMWGDKIVGFGRHLHGKGQTPLPLIGFAPRKKALTIYIMPGVKQIESYLEGLGKFSTSKTCLYVKKLEDVDSEVLAGLIKRSAELTAELNE